MLMLDLLIFIFPSIIFGLSPILNGGNPSAIPVQNFDFVYIPKHVVESHLPSFYPTKLKMRAERIAKEFKVEGRIPLNCMGNQVQLVDWYDKHQMAKKDPQGIKRRAIKKELDKLNMELSLLIPLRRNFYADLERLQQSIRIVCVPPNINSRLNDLQFKECGAMKQQETLLSSELMKLNQKERQILRREKDLRRNLKNL